MSDKKLFGVGIFAAIAASLCCIAPLLALIAGVSGLASAFTWVEPLRPYLIGITILTLGFAWHQKLKPKKEITCECEIDEKSYFFQSKRFLGIVTVFAILMLSFPYYNTAIFAPKNNSSEITKVDLTTVNLQINGMTCEGCEASVSNYATAAGSEFVTSNHKTGEAIIKFNKNKTNIDSIISNIELLGYEVTREKQKNILVKSFNK